MINGSSSLRILVCWSGRPGYAPAPTMSPNQITIYSHHDRLTPGLVNPPRQLSKVQNYDLEEVVSTICPPGEFDLICISCAADDNNKPQNLAAFSCPKVLLLTDTHHLSTNPIKLVQEYMEREQFDALVSLYNKDHMKWFRSFTGLRLGWFPGFSVENVPHLFTTDRRSQICFVGNWRRQHPRRKSVIDKIIRDQLPFDLQKLSRRASAALYGSSLISLNCSLNGDLNMRIYEILSAGGFLLTDQLSAASGIDEMLEPGKDYVSYSDYSDLKSKAAHYLKNPRQAISIARNGLSAYQTRFRPGFILPRFVHWALESKYPEHDYRVQLDEINGADMATRLAIYEYTQRHQLWREKTRILALGPKSTAALEDLKGFIRVQRWTLNSDSLQLPEGVAVIDESQVGKINWPIIVADDREKPRLASLKISSESIFTL